jgi:hypothetical protein
MSLVLRPTVWLDGEKRPNDYTVFHEGQKVGRIYRVNSISRELWQDAVRSARAYARPNGGVADSLDEAKAALRAMDRSIIAAPASLPPPSWCYRSGPAQEGSRRHPSIQNDHVYLAGRPCSESGGAILSLSFRSVG